MPHLTETRWRKSSYSGSQDDHQCVELAALSGWGTLHRGPRFDGPRGATPNPDPAGMASAAHPAQAGRGESHVLRRCLPAGGTLAQEQ